MRRAPPPFTQGTRPQDPSHSTGDPRDGTPRSCRSPHPGRERSLPPPTAHLSLNPCVFFRPSPRPPRASGSGVNSVSARVRVGPPPPPLPRAPRPSSAASVSVAVGSRRASDLPLGAAPRSLSRAATRQRAGSLRLKSTPSSPPYAAFTSPRRGWRSCCASRRLRRPRGRPRPNGSAPFPIQGSSPGGLRALRAASSAATHRPPLGVRNERKEGSVR